MKFSSYISWKVKSAQLAPILKEKMDLSRWLVVNFCPKTTPYPLLQSFASISSSKDKSCNSFCDFISALLRPTEVLMKKTKGEKILRLQVGRPWEEPRYILQIWSQAQLAKLTIRLTFSSKVLSDFGRVSSYHSRERKS